MVMPHECGLCGKKANKFYAMFNVFACEPCWELHENPEYIASVRESEHELKAYKNNKKYDFIIQSKTL